MEDIERRFRDVYSPLIEEFVAKVSERNFEDYRDIPHPFLPLWGRNYEKSLVRMAVVGKETCGWSPDLPEWLVEYRVRKDIFIEDLAKFRRQEFRSSAWMGDRPTRASFWGFWMNVVAKTYGREWETLKNGTYERLLDSFVWGNANAIETETSKGVDHNAPGYGNAKEASRIFDSIDLLEKVFVPHVVILTCSKTERIHYMGDGFRLIENVDDRVDVYRRKDMFVFHMPHPNNQRFHEDGADRYAAVVRRLLIEHGLFCPLAAVRERGLSDEAQSILVCECAKVDKFEAIAKVARGLRNQDSVMTARDLCMKVLNPAGHTTDWGSAFTGNGRGPCKLVSAAWKRYNGQCPDIAEDIALAFTRDDGFYAYEE